MCSLSITCLRGATHVWSSRTWHLLVGPWRQSIDVSDCAAGRIIIGSPSPSVKLVSNATRFGVVMCRKTWSFKRDTSDPPPISSPFGYALVARRIKGVERVAGFSPAADNCRNIGALSGDCLRRQTGDAEHHNTEWVCRFAQQACTRITSPHSRLSHNWVLPRVSRRQKVDAMMMMMLWWWCRWAHSISCVVGKEQDPFFTKKKSSCLLFAVVADGDVQVDVMWCDVMWCDATLRDRTYVCSQNRGGGRRYQCRQCYLWVFSFFFFIINAPCQKNNKPCFFCGLECSLQRDVREMTQSIPSSLQNPQTTNRKKIIYFYFLGSSKKKPSERSKWI